MSSCIIYFVFPALYHYLRIPIFLLSIYSHELTSRKEVNEPSEGVYGVVLGALWEIDIIVFAVTYLYIALKIVVAVSPARLVH